MRIHAFRRLSTWFVLTFASLCGAVQVAPAQTTDPQGIIYNVQAPHQRLEMVVNSSRILTLEQKVPTAQVGNRDVLDLTALSPTQIQVFAKKAGVTQINLWNERNEIKTIDVVVFGDARELKLVLEAQFPRASLTVTPLANSVIIGGFVDRPDMVNRIVRIAEDYHPNIINNITVGGVQQVLLDVKVMEVSRTNLRQLGVDLAHFNGGDFMVTSVSGLIQSFTSAAGPTFAGQTFAIGVTHANSQFFGVVDALKQAGVAKIVADPKIMTVSGRPARFLQGGEFPVLVPQSLGTVSVEYRSYGTEVDFVPIVLGNGLIRLELRPRVSEPDPALSVTINGTTVPALTSREVDTGVEMRAGQTLAIAGLVQTRTISEVSALPWIGEMPYIGALFRRTSSRQNEVETLILVTPHLVDAMDCHEVPYCGPGMRTTHPNDHELYLKGYIEVPKCCPPEGGPHGHGPMPTPYEGSGPQGGYYHGEIPAMPQGPGPAEELGPPQVPQPPMVDPSGFRPKASPKAAPPMPQPSLPSMPKAAPLPTSSPLPPLAPLPDDPSARQTRSAPPAAVRRASPPLPSHDNSVGEPGGKARQERQIPSGPRHRTAAIPASTGPSFIGPTGYDVD
jgi:pilus assembly protein CpaC